MYHEIDRKFLIHDMPDLDDCECITRTRYFLQHNDLVEEFIEESGGMYNYQIKTAVSPQERTREKKILSQTEFAFLQEKASQGITRESYLLSSDNPRITIKKYKGEYEGLIFAEVEFNSKDESDSFSPLPWMETEITDTQLGRDAWLLALDREHFLQILDTQNERLTDEHESVL